MRAINFLGTDFRNQALEHNSQLIPPGGLRSGADQQVEKPCGTKRTEGRAEAGTDGHVFNSFQWSFKENMWESLFFPFPSSIGFPVDSTCTLYPY
jgi:hypothetical protein